MFNKYKIRDWFYFFFRPNKYNNKVYPPTFWSRIQHGRAELQLMKDLGDGWDEMCTDCQYFHEPERSEEDGWCEYFDDSVDAWRDGDGEIEVGNKTSACDACGETDRDRWLYAYSLKHWDRNHHHLIWWWQEEKNWTMETFLLKDKDIILKYYDLNDSYHFEILNTPKLYSVQLRLGFDDKVTVTINHLTKRYDNFRFRNRLLNKIPKAQLAEDVLLGKKIAIAIRNQFGL